MRLIHENSSQCLVWIERIVEEGVTVEDAREVIGFLNMVAASDEGDNIAMPLIYENSIVGQMIRRF